MAGWSTIERLKRVKASEDVKAWAEKTVIDGQFEDSIVSLKWAIDRSKRPYEPGSDRFMDDYLSKIKKPSERIKRTAMILAIRKAEKRLRYG